MMKFIVFLLTMLAVLPVEAQDTVKMKSLKNINSLYYEEKTGSLYTGLAATYHSNGAVASLYNIFNGVKSGKVQIFFDSGKKRIITYEDENNVNYGETKVWNEDGTVAFEGRWINGKLFKKNETNPYKGEIKVYYYNGRINERSEFSDGMWNGIQTIWDKNGKVISDCVFKDNKIVDCRQ